MAISERTRKVLWGRSGNRCAVCKNELVIAASLDDDESVVADECHIISPRPEGPRHDPTYPSERVDAYENLILLCRTHHKMVDDQMATFTVSILRQMKLNHEIWVAQKLGNGHKTKPIRIRRIKQNIPSFLSRLTTGKEVLDVVANAMGYSFDHDELKSQDEVDLVGRFLELAQDWGDLDLDAGVRVQAVYSITKSLREVEQNGFFVFGGREMRFLEGGLETGPTDWPIAILWVLRQDNRAIVHIDLDNGNTG